jgi:hypothetical protein
VVDIPAPTSADLNRVNEVLRNVSKTTTSDKGVPDLLLDEPQVMGVEALRKTPSTCAWWRARCPASSSKSGARCVRSSCSPCAPGRHRDAERTGPQRRRCRC